MAKGPSILAVAAALGALVWIWPSGELPPPSTPHRSEQDAVTECSVPAIVREEVKLSEQTPPPDQAKPAEDRDAHKPVAAVEPLPEWINKARFVEAGLTDEQAAELVEGMRRLHELKHTFREDPKRSGDVIALQSLIMLDLGPTLADRIKDGPISLRWTPRLGPWPEFAGNSFAWNKTPGLAEPLSYSAHGRVGFVSLEIPRKLCDQELLALLVAACDAK